MGDERPSWRKRLLRGFGSVLMVVGTILVLATGALYAYSQYERRQFDLEEAAIARAELTEAAASTSQPTDGDQSTQTPTPTLAREPEQPTPPPASTSSVRSAESTVAPAPTASPTRTPALPPDRVVVPRIKLDSRVVESVVIDGEWTVPRFVAGHLQGTADPGEEGNVVLSGHIESISSGNVFANIGQIEVGDDIFVRGGQTWLRYVVVETKTVANSDLSVIGPQGFPSLTLITCTGNWLPLARDYDQRLIVVAKLGSEVPQERVPRFIQPQ
mgnify:CR=1 FL=1